MANMYIFALCLPTFCVRLLVLWVVFLARDHFHAAVLNDKLYVVGGRDSTAQDFFTAYVPEVDVYDFSTGTWSTLPDFTRPRGGTATTVFNGTVVVAAGEGDSRAWAEVDALQQDGIFAPLPDMISPTHGTGLVGCESAMWIGSGSTTLGGGKPNSDTFAFFDGNSPPACSQANIPSSPSPSEDSSPPPTTPPTTTSVSGSPTTTPSVSSGPSSPSSSASSSASTSVQPSPSSSMSDFAEDPTQSSTPSVSDSVDPPDTSCKFQAILLIPSCRSVYPNLLSGANFLTNNLYPALYFLLIVHTILCEQLSPRQKPPRQACLQ